MHDIAPSLSLSRGYNQRFASAASRPGNLVLAAGFAVFLVAWTLHASIAGADKSLHHDVLEAYAWGKEFRLGYHQHGPFWAWIAGAWFLLFPNTNGSFILLEGLNATLGLFGAWKLIGLFVNGRTRHAAALLLLSTPFYTFLAYKYNANTILISLWPWTLYFFVKSVDCMKLWDALFFGLFAAAAILSKYYAVILLLTCALSLLFHPGGRRYLLSPLPWAAAAVFFAAVSPHLVWSLNSGAPPVNYALSLIGRGWLFSAGFSGLFFLAAAAYHSLMASIIFLACRGSKSRFSPEEQGALPASRRKFLAVLVLSPLFLTVLFGLCFRMKISPAMALGTFPLMPLFLMQFAAPLDSGRCFRLSLAVAAALTFGAAASAPIERMIVDARSSDPALMQPRRELAAQVTRLWHVETGAPLRYAGGAIPYANAISFYSEDRPSSFPDLDFGRAQWVTPDRLRRYGLLIACLHEDGNCLAKAAGFLSGKWKRISVNIMRKLGSRQTPEAAFDVFIVPPQPV